MNQIEQMLNSREVAEMVGKRHDHLIRDIKKYIEEMAAPNLGEGEKFKIEPSDFFRESTYKDINNQNRHCYDVTKKGCEFIAHKLTGIKGTEFTAKYINRFHEMEAEFKSTPAAGKKKVTFLQEVKAAEHIVKGMNQAQKIEFYKSIYERHGLRLDIQSEPYLESKGGSYREQYRNESINAIRQIHDEIKLRQIYTISKKMLKREMESKNA